MPFDLVRERVRRHFALLAKPEDVVRKLVAVQAQDYLGSLWAVGLRTKNATELVIEQALAERRIVRTWPLRGTLHFVAAEDARWMLEIAGPSAIAKARTRHRQLGLDDEAIGKSRDLFERALSGGKSLSRREMYEVLTRGKVSPEGQRGIHILLRLAQERVICFGARRGKEQMFALADDCLPKTKKKTREEGLAELARRYFEGHGPATLDDFRWWSGLIARDARDALELAMPRLDREAAGERVYYSSGSPKGGASKASTAYLLPAFDEYLVGYRDRQALLKKAPALSAKTLNAGGGMLAPTVVVGGQVVGTWKRTLGRDTVKIAPNILARVSKAERVEIEDATAAYANFVSRRAERMFLK